MLFLGTYMPNFTQVLFGVIIVFAGVGFLLLGFAFLLPSVFRVMYGIPDLGTWNIVVAVILLIFGLALMLYGRKLTETR